jgi:hypothetical protein
MIKSIINITDKEYKAFSVGYLFGTFVTLVPIISLWNISKMPNGLRNRNKY